MHTYVHIYYILHELYTHIYEYIISIIIQLYKQKYIIILYNRQIRIEQNLSHTFERLICYKPFNFNKPDKFSDNYVKSLIRNLLITRMCSL